MEGTRHRIEYTESSSPHHLLAKAEPLPARQRKKSERKVKEATIVSELADGGDEGWRS